MSTLYDHTDINNDRFRFAYERLPVSGNGFSHVLYHVSLWSFIFTSINVNCSRSCSSRLNNLIVSAIALPKVARCR